MDAHSESMRLIEEAMDGACRSGAHMGYIRGISDALQILLNHGCIASPAYVEIYRCMTGATEEVANASDHDARMALLNQKQEAA